MTFRQRFCWSNGVFARWTHRCGAFVYKGLALASLSGIVASPTFAQTTIAGTTDDPRAAARHRDALLARPVTLDLVAGSRIQAIDLAAASSRVAVQYQAQLFEAYPAAITIHAKHRPLRDVLDRALAGTPFRVIADGATQLAIVRANADDPAVPKDGSIRGRVVDSASGTALARAAVVLDELNKRDPVMTDDGGKFIFPNVPPGDYTLRVKLLGYRAFMRHVTVRDGETTVTNATLVATSTMLTQVVTTATGVQRRLDVANDITTLDVDQIRKNAPVSTMTDLLDGRVTDLIVTRGSGAPGSPSRIRIRGNGSINASNDPIIVVDGVRQYSNQTTSERDAQYSVLDHMDLDAIDHVDILKGPSASSLYGSDAANGVIAITTKRGKVGKTRWNVATDQTITTQPRNFPEQAVLEGHDLNGFPIHVCNFENVPCIDTRLIRYNPLADDRQTVLGTGYYQAYRANVSGGVSAVQYFVSLSTNKNQGLFKMSDADVDYLTALTGRPVPGWQRRPESSDQANASSRVSIQITPTLMTDLAASLDRTNRTNTPLGNALNYILGSNLPGDTSLVQQIENFRQRQTWHEVTWRNIANANWIPRSWLILHGDAGLTSSARESNQVLMRGDCPGCNSDLGSITRGRDTRTVGSVTARGTMQLPTWNGIRLTPQVQLNYIHTDVSDEQLTATGLPLGSQSLFSADDIGVIDTSGTPVELGMLFNTTISVFDRWSTSLGFRTDASNSLGKNIVPTYPTLGFSYVIPTEHVVSSSALSLLRVRVSYGHSAVQPDLGASVRTYLEQNGLLPGGESGPVLGIATLGNPDLRPERSTELEGGFDTRFFNDRIELDVTGHRKLSHDALVVVDRPPSVGGGQMTTNLGSVRNAGGNVSLSVVAIDRPNVSWNMTGLYSRNANSLVKIASTFDRSLHTPGYSDIFGNRFVEGYPINGLWLRPVVGYSDVNRDGIIAQSEIVRSDSSVFVGSPLPKYELNFSTTLGVWHNRLTLAANTKYDNGTGQVNDALLRNLFFNNGFGVNIPALADPATSLEEQAAIRSGYSLLHPVSTFRIQSFSVRLAMPDAIAQRWFRATGMSVALQGTNVGLWTNYSGADPNVSSSIVGNGISDNGTLPQPRSWGLNVTLNY